MYQLLQKLVYRISLIRCCSINFSSPTGAMCIQVCQQFEGNINFNHTRSYVLYIAHVSGTFVLIMVITTTVQHIPVSPALNLLPEHVFKGNVYFTQGSDNLRAVSCQGNYWGTIANCLSSMCIWVYPTEETGCVSYYTKPACADNSVHVFKVAWK